MDIVAKITQAIEPSLEALGYRLVLIKLADSARRKTLTIMAERTDDQVMSFDDCTEISRTVSALLDVEDPITTAYDLEVSSPGIDRPLTRQADFGRYVEYEVKIETILPIDGRKRFRGILQGIDKKDLITVVVDNAKVEIPFASLRTAKLVMTDALVEAYLKKQKKSKQ